MGKRILIIGKKMPPIGGVTIHVTRLVEWLSKLNYPFSFIDLNNGIKLKLVYSLLKHKNMHLHTSSPYLQFFISVFCFLCFKNLITTYHGDISRFRRLKSIATFLSIKLSSIPIVLNERSLKISSKWNRKTIIVSSFLPPIAIEALPNDLNLQLSEVKANYKEFYVTNASDINFDKYGNEIYGITFLVKMFGQEMLEKAIIISDPTGNYNSYLKNKLGLGLTKNVFIFAKPHSFLAVMRDSSGYIRNTSTDGDSISIKEALYHKVNVYATDVISRPTGVNIFKYNDKSSLLASIENCKPNTLEIDHNAINMILPVYDILLK